MRKNISKVLESFLKRVPVRGDSKGTCSTDGQAVFSYAMPIAQRMPSGVYEVIRYDKAPSATTRSQVRAVQDTLGGFKSSGCAFVDQLTRLTYAEIVASGFTPTTLDKKDLAFIEAALAEKPTRIACNTQSPRFSKRSGLTTVKAVH